LALELAPIFMAIFFTFIGILLAFVLGIFGFYSKLMEIVKSLTKIEEHTSRIRGLEDKMFELRLTLEKGKLSSVPIKLPKSKVELVVKVMGRDEDMTTFEMTAKEPIPKKVANNCLDKVSLILSIPIYGISTYELNITFKVTDAKKAAEAVKVFLDALDEEWFKEKHWEDDFKAEMTKGSE